MKLKSKQVKVNKMGMINGIFKSGVKISSGIEKTLRSGSKTVEAAKEAEQAKDVEGMSRVKLYGHGGDGPKGPGGDGGHGGPGGDGPKGPHGGHGGPGGDGPKGPHKDSFAKQYGSAALEGVKGQALKHPLIAGGTAIAGGIVAKDRVKNGWDKLTGKTPAQGNGQVVPTANNQGQSSGKSDTMKNAALLGGGALGGLLLGGNGKMLKTGILIAVLAMIAKNFDAISKGIGQLGDKGQAMADNSGKLTTSPTGGSSRTPNESVDQAKQNQRQADSQVSDLNSAGHQQYLSQTKSNIQHTVNNQPQYRQQLQGPANTQAQAQAAQGGEVTL